MMGIFAMMVIPGNIDTTQNEFALYGMANMVKHDALGNEVFQQSVHNQLTNEGEQYILQASFADGTTAQGNTVSFGAICVSDQAFPAAPEDETALLFDTDNGFNTAGQLTCEQDGTSAIVITGGKAVIGPFEFTEDAVANFNIPENGIIESIGVCQQDDDVSLAAPTGFLDCDNGSNGTGGKLLAVIDVTTTTLGDGETVDITYTFDISDANS